MCFIYDQASIHDDIYAQLMFEKTHHLYHHCWITIINLLRLKSREGTRWKEGAARPKLRWSHQDGQEAAGTTVPSAVAVGWTCREGGQREWEGASQPCFVMEEFGAVLFFLFPFVAPQFRMILGSCSCCRRVLWWGLHSLFHQDNEGDGQTYGSMVRVAWRTKACTLPEIWTPDCWSSPPWCWFTNLHSTLFKGSEEG